MFKRLRQLEDRVTRLEAIRQVGMNLELESRLAQLKPRPTIVPKRKYTKRTKTERKQLRDQKMIAQYKRGYSIKSLAEKYNMTYSNAYRIVKEK